VQPLDNKKEENMRLPINKDGNIELDLFDIVSEVVGKATEEERQTMVEYFGMQEPIRKWMVERLAEEYSRPSFYEEVHNDRKDFLRKIKDEELAFYASLIVERVNDECRHQQAYWKLYYWCSANNITRMNGFPSPILHPSDWDWRKELEDRVKQIIKTERSDLLGVSDGSDRLSPPLDNR